MSAKKQKFITIKEAADYLGFSTRTIRNYISQGRLTGYKVGARSIRIDKAEVDALLRPMPNAKTV